MCFCSVANCMVFSVRQTRVPTTGFNLYEPVFFSVQWALRMPISKDHSVVSSDSAGWQHRPQDVRRKLSVNGSCSRCCCSCLYRRFRE